MLWTQATVCFCIWVAYGIWFARVGSGAVKPRGPVAGPLSLILGMLVMLGGLYAVYSIGGLVQGTMTSWAFVIVLVTGAVFVHMQCLGAKLILLCALRPETRPQVQTSDPKEDSL